MKSEEKHSSIEQGGYHKEWGSTAGSLSRFEEREGDAKDTVSDSGAPEEKSTQQRGGHRGRERGLGKGTKRIGRERPSLVSAKNAPKYMDGGWEKDTKGWGKTARGAAAGVQLDVSIGIA